MPHSTDAEQDDSKFTSADESLREGDSGRSIAMMANCVRNNHSNLINIEYHGSNSSGGVGSGSSSSSSGGAASDDDEGGECSLDSYQSDKNSISSPNANKCQDSALPVSPVLPNGIEVKPCPSVVNDNLRDRLSITHDNSESTGAVSPENKDDSDAGGRLRFYLDGRCVLELRHDYSNDGHPKHWVQSYGKTYRATVASIRTNCTPAWQPQDSSNHGLSEENLADSPTATLSPNKKKPYNNACMTFFVKNRLESNLKTPAFCVLRKASRRPGEVLSKELCCLHEKKCQKPQSLRHRTTTLFQKSQRLNQLVDKLAIRTCGETLPILKSDRKSSPLSCLLLGALIQKKGTESVKNLHSNAKGKKIDEDEKNDVKPLPEWYFDPAKSSIPVDEMIGNPRPSLLSPQINSVSHKRHADELSLTETKKLAKEENDTMDDDVKSQSFSSHCVPHSKSSSLDKTAVTLPTVKIEGVPAEDGGAVGVVNSAGKNNDNVQRKKKKGGGYGRGRTIGEAVRTYVISEILNLGGDVRTNYVPRGVFTEVASRYKIDATTTYRWWLKYCNGIRMAATGNLNQPDTSHKAFLSSRAAAAVPVIASEMKARADNFYKEANALHNSRIIESSVLKRDHSSLLTAGNHSLPHGGRYSPRSDDSASSGASLVDPASLYVSSLTLAPHTGVWPAGVPLTNLPNGHLPFQTSRLPLPLNVCVPYLWNSSIEQPVANGVSKDKPSHLDSRSSPLTNSDEPLDLTVPKREKKEGSFAQSSKMEDIKSIKPVYTKNTLVCARTTNNSRV
ncbi:hypothetical protein CHUAL_012265 [Chamberlinius hualienensis]